MKVYIAHFVDYNFQEKEAVTKPYPDLNILMCLCNFIIQTFTHIDIGFWIKEKEI